MGRWTHKHIMDGGENRLSPAAEPDFIADPATVASNRVKLTYLLVLLFFIDRACMRDRV